MAGFKVITEDAKAAARQEEMILSPIECLAE
jgi:hypothetical protein